MRLEREDIPLMTEGLDLNAVEVAALAAFSGADTELRTSEIMERVEPKVSRQYLIRHLGDLVDKGLLAKEGAGPKVRYVLDEEGLTNAYFAVDPLLRADKPFDMGIIRDYEPNVSRLMPEDMARELRKVSDASIKAGDTINRVVFRRYMVDFAWASSRMEGNTYTLIETHALLDEGEPAQDRSEGEAQMLRNHADAIEYVIDNARDLRITPMELRGIHAMLSRGLLSNPDDEGRIRRSIVEIGRSVYRPASMPQVLEEGLALIADRAREIRDPFEQSLFLLVQLSYLQPFIDVNKRTARVAANIPLLKAGLCPLSFYGMDEDAYVEGLLAWYELNTPTRIARTYREGYRAAAERYRSYGSRLSDNIGSAGDGERRRTAELVTQYLRAVVAGATGPDEKDRFLRTRIEGGDPMRRDTMLVAASKAIDHLDEVSAMGMGVSKSLLKAYRRAVEAYEGEDPGPR